MKLPLTLLAALAVSATVSAQQATPAEAVKIKPGFQVELLYSVPKEEQGSWVAMTQDDKGRLIVSDQYGALYRVTPPALGAAASETKVEKVPVERCMGWSTPMRIKGAVSTE